MSVVAPPEPPRPDELEALIREARARQRRRLFGAAAAVALLAGAALGISSIVAGRNSATSRGRRPVGVETLPRCRADQLRLARPRFNGAYTGHSVTDYTFVNASSSSCALRGWPTLGLVLRGRRIAFHDGRVSNRTERSPIRVRTVALRPRGAASFNVVFSDFDPSRNMGSWPCTGASFVFLVTAPGTHVPLRTFEHNPYCGPLHGGYLVTPLVPGRLDRYQSG